jgi:Fur family ferric uptake transcriptional regulator
MDKRQSHFAPGSRMTRQRRVILDVLREDHGHPTADDVYEMVRRRLPRISLGTVYRNLELLVEQGSVRKLELRGQARRFDGDLEAHHHIRCMRCNRVADAPAGSCRVSTKAVQRDSGFDVLEYRLEFAGICPDCRDGGGESGGGDGGGQGRKMRSRKRRPATGPGMRQPD